ncbi:molybdate ABC transporter substrate-binding protein [Brackiella oedipodis]|uniref:molybdate ABC transporter substrate-binding protein n=1 Tax=Brackiella oedipodis TaxID=124225 RepID=UPI00048CDF73|nr:molybdate ABC transporter substrate-binding protein [Brackiella oedipodis]
MDIKKPLVALGSAAAITAVASQAQAGTITVSAASSLTNAVTEIAQNYEKSHAGDKVELNFAASGTLLQQLKHGAPVDVFISADEKTMDQAQDANLLDKATRADLLKNSLVLIAPKGSGLKINSLDDLKNTDVKRIAVGNPDSVPAGRYTKAALEKANLWDDLGDKVVNTQNVRQALDYTARKEVQVGFVFKTDALIMKDKVDILQEVPLSSDILYPVAQLQKAPEAKDAQKFIEYLNSPEAIEVFKNYGFDSAK